MSREHRLRSVAFSGVRPNKKHPCCRDIRASMGCGVQYQACLCCFSGQPSRQGRSGSLAHPTGTCLFLRIRPSPVFSTSTPKTRASTSSIASAANQSATSPLWVKSSIRVCAPSVEGPLAAQSTQGARSHGGPASTPVRTLHAVAFCLHQRQFVGSTRFVPGEISVKRAMERPISILMAAPDKPERRPCLARPAESLEKRKRIVQAPDDVLRLSIPCAARKPFARLARIHPASRAHARRLDADLPRSQIRPLGRPRADSARPRADAARQQHDAAPSADAAARPRNHTKALRR